LHRWVTAGVAGYLAVLTGIVGASAQSRPSSVTCDSYARNYAANASRQGQVLRGGAVGSLVGLGIGIPSDDADARPAGLAQHGGNGGFVFHSDGDGIDTPRDPGGSASSGR